MSKSSKFANPEDDPNPSFLTGKAGRGGAGRGGGCLAFFGGKAGDGDSGACGEGEGVAPFGGACSIANGSLSKASFPV